jgi:hypothetical protein
MDKRRDETCEIIESYYTSDQRMLSVAIETNIFVRKPGYTSSLYIHCRKIVERDKYYVAILIYVLSFGMNTHTPISFSLKH